MNLRQTAKKTDFPRLHSPHAAMLPTLKAGDSSVAPYPGLGCGVCCVPGVSPGCWGPIRDGLETSLPRLPCPWTSSGLSSINHLWGAKAACQAQDEKHPGIGGQRPQLSGQSIHVAAKPSQLDHCATLIQRKQWELFKGAYVCAGQGPAGEAERD